MRYSASTDSAQRQLRLIHSGKSGNQAKTICIAVSIFALALTSVADIQLDVYKAKWVEQLKSQDQLQATGKLKVNATYLEFVDRLKTRVQQKGDLDKTTMVLNEAKRFKEQHSMPARPSSIVELAKLQKAYAAGILKIDRAKSSRIATILAQYDAALGQLQKRRVREGKMDDALAIKAERTKAQKTTSSMPGTSTVIRNMAAIKTDHSNRAIPSRLGIVQRPVNGKLYITCDNSFTVWWNGRLLGTGKNWQEMKVFDIKVGDGDILAIKAVDSGRGRRSAGLYCSITLADREKRAWGSSTAWHCSTIKQDNNWLTSKLPLKSQIPADTGNLHSAHQKPGNRYQQVLPALHGRFIWSKNAAKVIYVKEIINLNSFK